MKHPLLREEVQVVATPCNDSSFEQTYFKAVEGCTPLLIYAFSDDALSEKVGSSVVRTPRLIHDLGRGLHILGCMTLGNLHGSKDVSGFLQRRLLWGSSHHRKLHPSLLML